MASANRGHQERGGEVGFRRTSSIWLSSSIARGIMKSMARVHQMVNGGNASLRKQKLENILRGF